MMCETCRKEIESWVDISEVILHRPGFTGSDRTYLLCDWCLQNVMNYAYGRAWL
jgi:hypothetical protein